MFDRIKGHTLLELMAALAIVSVLIFAAIPLFSGYTEQGKIDELKAYVLKAAAAQEKYFANTGKYASQESALNSYGFPQEPSPKMKLSTGAIVLDGIGMTYWVAGNYDINSSVSNTYNECWVYFGQVLGTGNADNFMRLHDETRNISTDPSTCPLTNKKMDNGVMMVCDLDAMCK